MSQSQLSNGAQKYIQQIQGCLHQDNFWRLFVDGRNQRKGFLKKLGALDESDFGYLDWALREPHGLKMMQNTATWLFTRKNINKPLSLELIEEIHERAFPLEDHFLFSREFCRMDGGRVFGEFKPSKATVENLEGRARAIQKITKSNGLPWVVLKDNGAIAAQWTINDINKNIVAIIENYYRGLAEAATDETKLQHILQLAQDLENIHIFKDGNCRTMINLVLNKELISHGFSPAIFSNPNEFDYSNMKNLLKITAEGQAAFGRFVDTGYPYEDCVKEQTILSNICKSPKISPETPYHHGAPSASNGVPLNNTITMLAFLQRLSDLAIKDFLSTPKSLDRFSKFWDKLVAETKASVIKIGVPPQEVADLPVSSLHVKSFLQTHKSQADSIVIVKAVEL